MHRPFCDWMEERRNVAIHPRDDRRNRIEPVMEAADHLSLPLAAMLQVFVNAGSRVADHGTMATEKKPGWDFEKALEGVHVSGHVPIGRSDHDGARSDDVVSREEPAAARFEEAAVTRLVARRVQHSKRFAVAPDFVTVLVDEVRLDAGVTASASMHAEPDAKLLPELAGSSDVVRVDVREEDRRDGRPRRFELAFEESDVLSVTERSVDQRDVSLTDEVLIRTLAGHDAGVRRGHDAKSRLDLHRRTSSTISRCDL